MEKNTIAIVVGVVVGVLVLLAVVPEPAALITPTLIQEGVVQVVLGGSPDETLLHALSNTMPWFDRTIDVVIVPSLAKKDVQGLRSVLDRYSIGMVLLPNTQPADAESRQLLEQIIDKHIPYRFASYGQTLTAGSVVIRPLSPLGRIKQVVVRVDDRGVSFISSYPSGVSERTLRSLRVPDDAFRVSVPSYSTQKNTSFTFLNNTWFMKCENETDLPFLQHVCTNSAWQ